MKFQYHLIYCLIILALALSFALLWVGKYNCDKCPEQPIITEPIQPRLIFPNGGKEAPPEPTKPQPKVELGPKKNISIINKGSKSQQQEVQPSSDIHLVVPVDYAPCSELQSEYYTMRYYSEKYNFANGIFTVEDSVSENKIQFRKVDFKKLVPDYTPRTKFYLGMQGATNFEKIRDFGPNIMIVTKRDQAIFVHWNALDKPANLTLGGYWLISLRRR